MIELRDYRDILVSVVQTGGFRGVRTPLVVDRKLCGKRLGASEAAPFCSSQLSFPPNLIKCLIRHFLNT